jgi:hypothetical protein
MIANDPFHEFRKRLRARDGEAACETFRRLTGQRILLARRRLDEPLRHKVDAEDVVQSTYKSFFCRCGRCASRTATSRLSFRCFTAQGTDR